MSVVDLNEAFQKTFHLAD